MKKLFSILLVFVLAFSSVAVLSSCGDDGKYHVGICQLVQHDALDAATNGFMDALRDEFGDEVVFENQNASNDIPLCSTIINNFVSKKYDLILANATPALQAAANATATIPVLGTSITEYGVALNIKNFSGTVGTNVSGTSDLAPLDDQAQMIIDLFPDASRIGILFCSAEANSIYQVGVVKDYLEKAGKTVVEYGFSDSNDVAQFTTRAASEVDAVYIPTDNTAASCGETIRNILAPAKVPVVAGEEGICRKCGLVTLSISYYSLGYKTGKMAAEILRGDKKVEEMAIAYDPAPVCKFNPTLCEEYGFTPPATYVAITD